MAPANLTFEALDFVYSAFVGSESVRLTMKEPRMLNRNLKLGLMSGNVEGTFVDTGAPHFVMFVDDVNVVDVANVGKEIRQNALAFPDGTNVNFVQVLADKSLLLRTFERGVEAETLACGTGSVASGIVSHVEKGLPLPISIGVRSGEMLKVSATVVGDKIRSPQLEGSAHLLFDGRFEYDAITHHLASPTVLGGR
jgi:diaminopimelate epimerase